MTAELKRLLDEATVGSREMDREVARWLGREPYWDDETAKWLVRSNGWHGGDLLPRYSTDLTSAVGLWRELLQSWDLRIESHFDRDGEIFWNVDGRDSFFEPEEGDPNPWTVSKYAMNHAPLAILRALYSAKE